MRKINVLKMLKYWALGAHIIRAIHKNFSFFFTIPRTNLFFVNIRRQFHALHYPYYSSLLFYTNNSKLPFFCLLLCHERIWRFRCSFVYVKVMVSWGEMSINYVNLWKSIKNYYYIFFPFSYVIYVAETNENGKKFF